MPKNPADWLPKLFTKSEGTVREATTKKFSDFAQVADGTDVQLVGLKGDSNIRIDVDDLTVEIPDVTTSTVMLETDDALRNRKGQFMSTQGMADLKTQKDANRYLAEALSSIPEISEGDIEAWNGYQADITSLEARVEQGETVQEAVLAQIAHALNEQTTIEGRVKTGEGVQQDIQHELATLSNKVNQIEGAVGEHTINFTQSNQTPRSGEFNLLKSDMTLTYNLSEAKHIQISGTDADGKPIDLDRIAEGDVLRISHSVTGIAELRITSVATGFYSFDQISGTMNDMFVGPYGFVLLSAFDPAGLATIDYVDTQDDLLRIAVSSNAIAVGSKAEKSYVDQQDASNKEYVDAEIGKLVIPDAADVTKEYVDSQDNALGVRIDGRMAKQGDNTLTDEFRIKQQNTSGNNNTLIVAKDGELNLYHVKYPTSDAHAANMKYVDDEIAKIVIPEIPEIPEASEALQPVLWTFMGTSTDAEDLNDGEFTFRYEGDQGSDGFFKIYTALRDASGQLIASPTTFQHNMQDKYLISIQGAEGGNNIHMKSKTFYFGVGTSPNQYHRFEARFWRVATGCTTGTKYVLNIPGILPTFSKPSDIGAFALPDEPPCGDIPPEAE